MDKNGQKELGINKGFKLKEVKKFTTLIIWLENEGQ